MNKAGERLYNGIIKENPTFVLMLGMCPTLAVTTSAMNGLGMKAGDVLVPQFHQKNVKSFTYTKTGSTSDSEIDAISGATITTKAVTNAVNGSLLAFHDYVQGGAGNE